MLLSLDIERVEPFADGAPFGEVGAYERVIGKARGEVDPQLPYNRGISLIGHAPLNARGCVEYTTDVFILRPKDPAKGNGHILYEVNNRGRKMLFGNLCDGPQGMNDPKTMADVGNGFPMHRGYTIVWSGWDPGAPRANMGLGLTVPVATHQGGAPIIQTVRDEFISGTRGGTLEVFKLSSEPTSVEQPWARLSVRARAHEPRQELPRSEWTFVDSKSIKLTNGTPLPGHIYEFHYQAQNPKVQSLGFAATRDLVSWLRYDPAAVAATGGKISHALAIGFSQAGRYLRNHISDGFNCDEQRRPVFDGVYSHIAGIGRIFFNTPFAQPARTGTQHEDHDFPENWFPFSTATQVDPMTEAEASLFIESEEFPQFEATNPKLIETNTSTEYWQKGASLLHTDPLGQQDATLPDNSRIYMIAGTQHGGRAGGTSDRGPNVNPRNPHNPMPAVRALLVALDEWVVSGKEPPPSRLPTLADGTLVPADAIGFPAIPGAAVAKATNVIAPSSDWVQMRVPERAEDDPRPHAYRTLVCKVDADGNEVAGIRLPDIAVPLATYTGWNEYKAPYPEGELADRDGSCLPFAADKAARVTNGDPRLSIAERYAGAADYVAKVQATVDALVADRLMLPEDAERVLERARRETRVAS